MTDLIERVARAICCPDGRCQAVGRFVRCGWKDERDKARAAISAVLDDMEEPSEWMRYIAAERFGFKPDEPHGQAEAVRISLWKAMLKQYRKEKLARPNTVPEP